MKSHSYEYCYKLSLFNVKKDRQKCGGYTYTELVNRNLSGFTRPSCSTTEHNRLHCNLNQFKEHTLQLHSKSALVVVVSGMQLETA